LNQRPRLKETAIECIRIEGFASSTVQPPDQHHVDLAAARGLQRLPPMFA